jgi:hypothetical protein
VSAKTGIPHDCGVEEQFLGAGMLPGAHWDDAAALVTAGDFYDPVNGHVFTAINAVRAGGDDPDAALVTDRLRRAGVDGLLGDRPGDKLVALLSGAPSRSTAPKLASIIAEHAARRRIQAAALELAEAAADQTKTLKAVTESVRALSEIPTGPTDGQTGAGPSASGLLRLGDLRGRALNPTQLDQLPAPVPLIDGILYLDTINALFGKPGVGKSFVTGDMALSVATGTWWLGHEVQRRPVIYIAAEGSAGLSQRKKAWEVARNVRADTALIVWLPLAVNLLDPEWIEGVALYTAELAAGFVIIDTASRSMPGGDEGARDMNRFVEALDQIRSTSGACVLAVHHDTKAGDGTLRGHSAFEGAVNTAIMATADGRSITLKNTKQKDAAEFEPIRLYLKPVAESCAVYCQTTLPSPDELTESEAAVLDALGSLAGSDGLSRSTLIRNIDIPERSIHRAVTALVNRGLVVNVATENRPKYVLRVEAAA